MSYQQQPGPPQPPPPKQPTPEEAQEKVLEEILGAQIPGTGYLFADDPEKRQGQLVETNPEFVRKALLRAIETMAFDACLPFGQEKKESIAKAILASAQAYLLLDPSVDENGIPVEGEGSVANAQAKAQQAFPPRVQLPPAAQAIAEKNKPKSEALKHDRGQTPRPQPRVGS